MNLNCLKFSRNILFPLFLLYASCGFGQEMSNEDYNRIIIMEGEFEGSLEVFVDPLHFDCTCDDVISHLFFPAEDASMYLTEDGSIRLEIVEDRYIFSFRVDSYCCAIRPGVYTMVPSRLDLETEEEEE